MFWRDFLLRAREKGEQTLVTKMTRKEFEEDGTKCVEKLRDRFKGELSAEMFADTAMFMRFLKARNFDLSATETMLRNHINWRRENKIDTFLSWHKPHEVAINYVPLGQIGFDKEGCAVIYGHLGNLDSRGILKAMKQSEVMQFAIYHLESNVRSLKTQSENLKKNIDNFVYILDCEHFSLSTATHKPTLEIFRKILDMYEGNYPERLKVAFLINASWYIQVLYTILKPFLSGPTIEKLHFFGREGWKQELLKLIDADQLPAFLGGNVTDPDGNPLCRTFIKREGLVPDKCFMSNQRSSFISQSEVKKLTVPRLSKEQIELCVLHPGSVIEWEFEIKERDIIFSLLFKDNSHLLSEAKEILPKQRMDCSVITETGLFKCEKPGMYIFEFDNSYSWIHQKEIYYKFQVNAPSVLQEATR